MTQGIVQRRRVQASRAAGPLSASKSPQPYHQRHPTSTRCRLPLEPRLTQPPEHHARAALTLVGSCHGINFGTNRRSVTYGIKFGWLSPDANRQPPVRPGGFLHQPAADATLRRQPCAPDTNCQARAARRCPPDPNVGLVVRDGPAARGTRARRATLCLSAHGPGHHLCRSRV
jgi:hypothetical protein